MITKGKDYLLVLINFSMDPTKKRIRTEASNPNSCMKL